MPEVDQKITLKSFIEAMNIDVSEDYEAKPLIKDSLENVQDVGEPDRIASKLATLVFNVDNVGGKLDKAKIQELIGEIDKMIAAQVDEILHNEKFQGLESAWRSLDDLVQHTPFHQNVALDLLDVTKDELYQDFDNNVVDITGTALFQKIYVDEYDQYGGRPFGGMIGNFDFEYSDEDFTFLRSMAKVANAAHAPFVSAVSPRFFGCETIQEAAAIRDLEGLLAQPKFGKWKAFRDSPEAAYIGLCFPRYLQRTPYDPEINPCRGLKFYKETVDPHNDKDFLWGNSAMLFARNMIRSFKTSGWCQYLRGPKAGGLVTGLPVHTYEEAGREEFKIPVELVIPDYRELEFANSGFIPLVYRKGTADACFFSAQSAKVTKRFKDPKDSENSQLVANLSYTLSITRIAHYVKSIMRDNIGSTADATYIQEVLGAWLSNYVTTVNNPDDLTLRYYPFKAVDVNVEARPGQIGFYDCQISVLPHLQFEGMDVELRLESRLG